MAVSCLFLVLLNLFVIMVVVTGSFSQDQMTLISLKNSIAGDPLNLLSDWNVSGDHCRWYGITCDSVSGRVVAVNITGRAGSGLLGRLPGSVGNLTELRILSLPQNGFSGEIPAEIGRLQFLEVLELQGNNLSGRIPNQIRFLSSLLLLNLSYNSLSGRVPDGLIGLGRLSVIDLSNNKLGEGFTVSDIGTKCVFLKYLKLSNNYLTYGIPAAIGNCFNLRTLLLDGNIFEDHIPVEIGRITELRVLDVSRNSFAGRIPSELANCSKLNVLVLTNVVDFGVDESGSNANGITRGEFNAFDGGVPYEILFLPNLEIFWAPRANLGGRLPGNWSDSCSLRMLNLGQNYFTGLVPQSMALNCKNLTFLDLSSNRFHGFLPLELRVQCMIYLNVSINSLSGALPSFSNGSCGNSITDYVNLLIEEENIHKAYLGNPIWGSYFKSDNFVVQHDFSRNGFMGSLPSFSTGDEFLANGDVSYRLLLNNNIFNDSLPAELFSGCNYLKNFSIDLSGNQISGGISVDFIHKCLKLTEFLAAENQFVGPIPPEIGSLKMLQRLDFGKNMLSGSLPDQLGELTNLRWILLSQNNLTGQIPAQLGHLNSLLVLNLSQNELIGVIPETLANASKLGTLLLDHNKLSGEIPLSFSNFSSLTQLDLSFNNLSGHIPHFQLSSNCGSFRGNKFLHSCPDEYLLPQTSLPTMVQPHKSHGGGKLGAFVIAMACSASFVLFVLLVVVLVLLLGRKRLSRITTLRRKGLVTFADTPIELNYDNVVGATGNFSIRNLIGTGGFGSTYKAELIPGFLVAVKRLAIGRFQGVQQFDAEIRTLGRIRHDNLVTLIGYYVGEAEMFLVYNYLSGGNLETFIHERTGKNAVWPVIHKIAIDIARALAFLHYSCVPRIVHRDIKPSNILLDEELNAYISDFGLARLLEVSETHATTDVAGTFGYVAPEYATTCRVSDKADVYSFGVVLLELMSRKKSLDPSFSDYGNGFNIVGWARLLIKENRSAELFCPDLWASGPHETLLEMLRLAAACTVESLSVRPTMKQVFERLKQLQP